MYHLSGKIALCFLSAALLLAACGPASRQRTVVVLDDVETYINERPDSALAVLTAVDTTSLTTRALKARYFLLKSVALDKNYIDDGSFLAEMETAAEWYALHGTMEERARAWFYFADQQKDADEIAEAVVNFSRALGLAEKGEDWFLAGMCARNMSDIYRSGFDYRRSLEYARKSVVYFSQAEAPAHVLYARLMLAEDYYNNGYSDICLNLCDSLQVEAASAGNSGVLADSYFTAAMVYIHKTPPQYDSTLILLDKAAKLYPLSVQQQALYAWSLYLKGDKLTAREMIISAQNAARTTKDSLYVLPWAARIAREAGDMEQYVALQEDIIEKTDAFTRNTILRSVDRAQAQYHLLQENRLSQEIQRGRLYLNIGLLFVILMIGFLITLAAIRRKRLLEKTKANELLSEKLALYGATVEETLDFSFDVLNKLSDAYYHPNTSQPDVFKSIMKEYVSDIASRKVLGEAIEQNINIIHDNVIAKLRLDVPALKEKDIKLFSLYLFGFSYKAISEFYPEFSSINSTYSRVSRLRKAIAESGSENTAFFLSFLERRSEKAI